MYNYSYFSFCIIFFISIGPLFCQSNIHVETNTYLSGVDGNSFGIGYDYQNTNNQFGIGVNYVSVEGSTMAPFFDVDESMITTKGIGFKITYHRFISSIKNGFFAGLQTDFQFLRNQRTELSNPGSFEENTGSIILQPTAQLGYQLMMGNKVVIQFFGGSGLRREIGEESSINNFVFTTGLKLGIIINN